MILLSSLPFFALLKITVFDKKTELGAEERIPIFFFESPPLRGCDIFRQGQSIIHLKNLWYVWHLSTFFKKFQYLFWFLGSTADFDWGLIRGCLLDTTLSNFNLFLNEWKAHLKTSCPELGSSKKRIWCTSCILDWFLLFWSIYMKNLHRLPSWNSHRNTFSLGGIPCGQRHDNQRIIPILELHEITICKYAAERQIPAIRVGRVWREIR